MKVVFFKDVEGTAQVGDIKDVKPGFARNYLLPRGLAGPTTKDNIQHALALAEREKRIQAKLDAEAQVTAGPLDGAAVTVEARVGESGRLFGSITNRDIAQAVKEAHGVEVDPHAVLLHEPIRELGERTVAIRFTRNVTADVTVKVVPDEESREIVEKLEAEAEARRLEEEKKAAEEAYRKQLEERAARARGSKGAEAEEEGEHPEDAAD